MGTLTSDEPAAGISAAAVDDFVDVPVEGQYA